MYSSLYRVGDLMGKGDELVKARVFIVAKRKK